ncbi:hypothetical protein PVK06_026029 [Gossypium arboreum]|uniref:Uncharacterized protein n=1 Tax=Gossypium arboreum TaxID=29729 RepID=A0ABR0NWK4_GOSAR|nr:hypothetical protein PVK06_026029 [Gossypium arboreum]
MIVVVTPLSGSEKLRLREVFASVQDSGSLLGYIRTYGIDSRSVSKLGNFIMENGLLDRVEGNANVHRWSEQTQLGKGDSITVGYMSELSDYTRISVTQNNLQELKAIWDQWGNETKQSFYVILPLGRIYSRAACVQTFGKKLMTITRMSKQWIMARIKEKGESKCIPWGALKDLIQTHPDEAKRVDIFALSLYGLMVFPKPWDIWTRQPRISSINLANGSLLFLRFWQRHSAWFYSHFRLIDRVVCRVFFEDYSQLKDIAASTRKVDVPEKNWIALLQNLQSKDVE